GLSEDVLRFMTVRVDAHEEGPSAMMQRRDDRDRGPRRDDRERGPRRDFDDRGPRRDFDDRGPRRPRESNEGGQ
ncbi:MAG TPA: 30S ribosomal protein S6, partial [Pseudorhizobium sp.]|nr:30S ribosomal protein S6 [Pseudorhizobium sp.]